MDKAVILRRLNNALDWIRANPEPGATHRRIATGCARLLNQSPTDYNPWARRNRGRADFYVRLVELTISDVDCAPYDYFLTHHLDDFTHSSKAVKAILESSCDRCGRKFRPKRKTAKFCGPRCKQAVHRRRYAKAA